MPGGKHYFDFISRVGHVRRFLQTLNYDGWRSEAATSLRQYALNTASLEHHLSGGRSSSNSIQQHPVALFRAGISKHFCPRAK